MADRVFLSVWLRGFTVHNMLRHYQKALECFPYSRLSPQALLRVHAIDFQEPLLLEQRFDENAEPPTVIAAARDFEHDDCAYQLECFWDLMQYDGGWSLRPAPVAITCFAPLFESDLGEQLLIEVGLDSLYLPDPELPGSTAPTRANLRSLLHLVSDLEGALPVDKRTLWSESGDNLAERLQEALEGPLDVD